MKYWTTLQKLMWLKRASGGSQEYSGDIVEFDTLKAKKLKNLIVNLSPIQDLNGYDAPWAGGAGKNKVDYLSCVGVGARDDSDSVSASVTVSSDVITMTGYASYQSGGQIFKGIGSPSITGEFTVSADVKCTASTVAFGVGAYEGGGTSDVSANYSVTANTWTHISRTFTDKTYSKIGIFLQPKLGTDTLEVKNLQLEAGSSATSFAPYSNLCPITGRTGAGAYLGAEHDPDTATLYSVDWTDEAGTVYSGTVDIVTGELRVRPEYSSYNGETLVGEWMSSMDKYVAGTTPTIGAQVVDLGGAETIYYLTPQEIMSLVGHNVVFSPDGSVTVRV